MRNLNFHQTFPPTLEYFSRLFDVVNNGIPMTKEEISSATGIPTGKSSGKVEPHIDYAVYMGLLEEEAPVGGKYSLRCTPLGNEIRKQDPGFREALTQLICHVRLTSPTTGAQLWSMIIRDILPKYKNGLKDNILEDEIRKMISGTIKTGPFYSTYRDSFDLLKLLIREQQTTSIVPQPLINDFGYVYSYALIYEWEKIFPTDNEISADELERLKFSGAFGWDAQRQYVALEHLAELGVIRLNRQLSPFTIYKLTTSDKLIAKLYSLLC